MAHRPILLFQNPAPLRLHSTPWQLEQIRTTKICRQTFRATAKTPSLEPNLPTETPTNLPPSLYSTTIYHNIPSLPLHHSNPQIPPLAHRNDGDGYILALSFSPAPQKPSWIRARFIRTRPFLVESRRQRRLYRGAYGTPGAVGINAPVKPKASAARGVFPWGAPDNQRVVTFGLRHLPLTLSRDVLVTRGPTALGKVLTDADEMLNERASELSLPPLRTGDRLLVVGVSRSSVGRLMACFLTEVDANLKVAVRHPKIAIPQGCDIASAAVDDRHCIIAMHMVAEERGGAFAAVLGTGKQKDAPIIDVDYGTTLFIVSRKDGRCATLRLPGIVLTRLTHSTSSNNGNVVVESIQFVRQRGLHPVRTSTIADAHHGHLWASDNALDFSATRLHLSFQINDDGKTLVTSEPDMKRLPIAEDTIVCDVATPSVRSSTKTSPQAYSIYNTARKQSGLAVCNTASASLEPTIWHCPQQGEQISGLCLSPDNQYVSALITKEDIGRLEIFAMDDIANGPINSIPLDAAHLGTVGNSVAGVWADHAADWSVDGNKPVKSSYEIFDSRDWNDINSNFSSLGL